MAVRYFTDLFRTTSPTDLDGFLAEVSTSVTEAQNLRLMATATEEEVKAAFFMMPQKKPMGRMV